MEGVDKKYFVKLDNFYTPIERIIFFNLIYNKKYPEIESHYYPP